MRDGCSGSSATPATEATLTGLPLVNRELAARFLPQFLKGLAIGSVVVLVLIVVAFRDWRLVAAGAGAGG